MCDNMLTNARDITGVGGWVGACTIAVAQVVLHLVPVVAKPCKQANYCKRPAKTAEEKRERRAKCVKQKLLRPSHRSAGEPRRYALRSPPHCAHALCMALPIVNHALSSTTI